MHTFSFSDEINFEKFKKVVKNLIKGEGIWTPRNPNFFSFFYDKSELEFARFLNRHNITVSGSGGG